MKKINTLFIRRILCECVITIITMFLMIFIAMSFSELMDKAVTNSIIVGVIIAGIFVQIKMIILPRVKKNRNVKAKDKEIVKCINDIKNISKTPERFILENNNLENEIKEIQNILICKKIFIYLNTMEKMQYTIKYKDKTIVVFLNLDGSKNETYADILSAVFFQIGKNINDDTNLKEVKNEMYKALSEF